MNLYENTDLNWNIFLITYNLYEKINNISFFTQKSLIYTKKRFKSI